MGVARRARFTLLIVALSSAVALIASGIHYSHGDILRAWFMAAAVVPFAGSVLVMHWTGRVQPAAHYLCALIAFFVVVSPFLSAESVPILVALIPIPLAGTVMGGQRIGLIWTGIVLLVLSASALSLPFSHGERHVAWMTAVIATGCGVALAFIDDALERAIQDADTARDLADENARSEARTAEALADSQMLFAAAFRRAPSILSLTVADTGDILDVNESFERISGYTREEMIGKRLVDLGIWPDKADRERYVRDVQDRGAIDGVELPLRTRSGERIWFMVSAEELDIDGRRCILSQGIDVTARKRSDELLARRREELELRFAERGEQLRESQEKLREQERLAAVGTLAAGIAHQINNPIGAIVAASEFALMEDAEASSLPALRGALKTVLDEARRCGRIVKSVLKFARDEPTAKWVEDLNPTVRRASELARSYVERLGGRLEIDLWAEAVPARISPIDIEQVVLNLVRNAAESRTGGARVRVSTRRLGDVAEVAVCDDGRGIDAEARSRILDPFYTTRLEDGGFGLGLSVAHGVIADHEGELEIDSLEAGGTRFRFRLPIVESDA